MIWLGFGANLLVVVALWLAGIIPAAGFREDQHAYDTILGQAPWILVASFAAYLIGEFSNPTVLSYLKYRMQGRLLFVRTISPTVVGQGFDSFIFCYIAFGLGSDWSAAALFGARPSSVGHKDPLRDRGHALYLRGRHLHEAQGKDGRYGRTTLTQPTGDLRLKRVGQAAGLESVT